MIIQRGTKKLSKIQNNAASSYLYDLFDTIHADAEAQDNHFLNKTCLKNVI